MRYFTFYILHFIFYVKIYQCVQCSKECSLKSVSFEDYIYGTFMEHFPLIS